MAGDEPRVVRESAGGGNERVEGRGEGLADGTRGAETKRRGGGKKSLGGGF